MNNMNSIFHPQDRYGGVCMDDDNIIDTSFYPLLSTILFDGNVNTNHNTIFTSSDIETLLLHSHFPVPDHDHQGKIDIATEDVLVYFKDPEVSTMDVPPLPLVLPSEGVEINHELSVFHLLMAYAEAKEMSLEDLADAIGNCLREKVSPVGDIVERLIYYMFQTFEKQSSDYLKDECMKNFLLAFKALYQIFPHGKFAHFAANWAILQSLSNKDVGTIHIFDFDIREGIQWASLIEAIRHDRGRHVELRIISVIFVGNEDGDEDEEEQPAKMWKFEDTKRRLRDHAASYGIKLEVEEMEWDDGFMEGIKRSKENQGRDFFVFNCMVGLPHMGMGIVRSRKDVFNYLQISQTFLQHYGKGIITFGDGEGWEKVRNAPNYTSYLDENMAHYQALLESIRFSFPSHLGDARTAIECLFVAPFVSCKAWGDKWAERKTYGNHQVGLAGLSLSKESLLEAKEVVKEGESLYGVRIGGESYNEMLLEWRGIEMVKVSCWRS